MPSLKQFETTRNESIRTRCFRWFYSMYPSYLGTGASIEFISEDYREIHVKIPFSWRTKNFQGNVFGGSIYTAVDPIFTLVLHNNLPESYEIVEQEAYLRFHEGARETLFGRFQIDRENIRRIKDELEQHSSVTRVYKVELSDQSGKTTYASVEKTFEISD